MIPRIAIIDQNTLEATGLKSIISDIAPMADVCTFASVEDVVQEFDAEIPVVHFFVSSQVFIANAEFFLKHQKQTIILLAQPAAKRQFENFLTLDITQAEHDLLKSILTLFQRGHSQHPLPQTASQPELSPREVEVLALVVRGFINKEIADRLCISLPTVITHRKNICEKLHLRSVSSLTIYAVTHGIVSTEDI